MKIDNHNGNMQIMVFKRADYKRRVGWTTGTPGIPLFRRRTDLMAYLQGIVENLSLTPVLRKRDGEWWASYEKTERPLPEDLKARETYYRGVLFGNAQELRGKKAA